MRAVNLIPAEHRGGATVGVGRSEGGAYAVLALAAGLALFAFLYGRADKQISSRRAQAATLTTQAQRAQAQAAQLAPYASFIAMREQRMQAVATLVDSRFDWAHVFHEFGRVLPASVSVSSLTGTIGGAGGASSATPAPAPAPAPAAPAAGTSAAATNAAAPGATTSASAAPGAAAASPVTSATPPGSVPTFTLAGCATGQPAVAQMLNRLRLIDGVANVTLQSSAKSAGSSTGGAGGAGCESGQAAYAAEVTFVPLPTPPATHSSTAVASTTATGSPTTPAGGAR
jgi:hypothetical protein